MFELRAKTTTETDILMYGSISEWGRITAEDFIKKISEAKSKGYVKANCKINCPGGSIFEGLAVMAQMNTQEIYITGIVEGMAASMGAVILQGCHKRVMMKGTRLMVHQGSGGVAGQVSQIRDYADLLESLNKTLADILSRRSKRKDAKWIMDNWMASGKDKWFTPEEALAEGLIDEIIEGNVKPLEKENASFVEMAAHYSQLNNKTTETEMKKEELIALLGLKADATEAEITAALNAMKAKADAAPAASAAPKTDAPAPVGGAEKVVEGIVALATAKGVTDEKQINAIKKLAAIDAQAAIDMIPAEASMQADDKKPVSMTELLAALKGGSKDGGASDKSKWTYKDYEKDPAALLDLAQNKPEQFGKLFQSEFGVTPSAAEISKLLK